MSMTYAEKLKDPRWQKKRLRIFERDNFTCRDCGDTEKTLHVHHCHYSKGEPWQTPDALLVTLCWKCHQARKSPEEMLKTEFAYLLVFLRNQDDRVRLFEAFQVSATKIGEGEPPSLIF